MPSVARPFFALLLGLLVGHGSAQTSAPQVTHDIPYTVDSTGTYLADLYQPSSPGTHPVVLMVHGGSWRSGHKSELRKLGSDLAALGFACFSIDYDTHAHSFPTSWQEARAAVAFLRAHATDYRIDSERIVVLGTSAGGQLAALLALAPDGPSTPMPPDLPVQMPRPGSTVLTPPPPPTPEPVAAAVLFNGGYDLHPKAYVLRRYLGGNCADRPAVCNDASPDNHIHPGAPPIFVGHGTRDRLIPYSQATTFVSLLQGAKDPVTPFIATGAGHSYWRNRHWYSLNLQAAEAFLGSALAPK